MTFWYFLKIWIVYFNGEVIIFEGESFPVLDLSRIDFGNAKDGIKTAKTKVFVQRAEK